MKSWFPAMHLPQCSLQSGVVSRWRTADWEWGALPEYINPELCDPPGAAA